MKKNVIFIVVDQMRFDCLGFNGNDEISTPNLDMLASAGDNYVNCYSAVPTCIAARAAIHTGLKQENHKRVGYEDGRVWNYDKTLASVFTNMGYQTEAIGKMHVYPERNRIGFEHVLLHDGYLHYNRNYDRSLKNSYIFNDDYLLWLKENNGSESEIYDNGLHCNSWVAKPWTLEERLHPTNWTTSNAIRFLNTRDQTKPYMMMVSYVRPHSPLDPPQAFLDMYNDVDINYPIGEWANPDIVDRKIDSIGTKLKKRDLDSMRRAYYASITHIDNQIGRLLIALQETGEAKNTVIAFVSDHGDQLGEHNLLRKAYPYQGSIHVPFFIFDPTKKSQGKIKEQLMELRDIFPTLVEVASGNNVTNIDGKSVLTDSLDEESNYIHGEHLFGEFSNHYIVTQSWKYIWFDQTGVEQLFNLEDDANEEINVIETNQKMHQQLRAILISELEKREENYIINKQLRTGAKRKATLK